MMLVRMVLQLTILIAASDSGAGVDAGAVIGASVDNGVVDDADDDDFFCVLMCLFHNML